MSQYRDVSINIKYDSEQHPIYRVGLNAAKTDRTRVRKITALGPTTDYVYDLETANHHFSAGIGELIVHNTDSLYLTCPDSVYEDADNTYKRECSDRSQSLLEAKERYWTKMVEITMYNMNQLKESVADYLLNDNGTLFLKMAYEEVGFPTVLCGKKKYYMIPHIERINFRPKELFIRGIDIIKQGKAKIAKELGEEFMFESVD